MKQLELFWDTLQPVLQKSTAEEQKKYNDVYRRLKARISQLETNNNLAIHGRAAVHALLKKTSQDLIQRYQIVFEYSGTAMIVIESDGTISLVNSYFEKLFGYTRKEVENKRNLLEFIEESYRDKITSYHIRRMEGEMGIPSHYEAKVLSKNEDVLDVVITVGKFPGVQQSVISVIDNTDRKRFEQELIRSEERYRLLYQNMSDGVVVHELLPDGPGKILEVNDRICEMLGYSRAELMTLTVKDLDVPEQHDKIPDLIKTLISTKNIVFETEYLTRDKDRILVEISARLMDLQGKQTILAIVRDITEKKILEHEMEFYTAELMRHARDLQVVNDKINLLNRITRHDINNQLMVILGILDIMLDECSDPEIHEFLNKELDAVKNIQEQIQFTKEYQDIGVQSPGWFVLTDLIESARENLPLSGISVTVMINEIEIFADPLIKKVFYTLFENAIRHGETITEIRFSAQESPDGLLIIFEDNGVGVPLQYKTDIFKQKYFKNTGFGLFLSVSILKITGISIRENGVPGQGSRFEILVPQGSFRYMNRS